jgi:ferrous iron transport protein A
MEASKAGVFSCHRLKWLHPEEINMKLYKGEIGKTYIVYGMIVKDAVTGRLQALGVNELTPVTLMNKKGSGTVIIKVRGTRLALGRKISEGIEIREAVEHE